MTGVPNAQDIGAPPSPAPSNGQFTRYSLETEVVRTEGSDQYNSSSVPIYQTATFKANSVNDMGEFDYTRSGNPTRSHLERHCAKIMGAKRALAVSSGMTALDVICRLIKTGQEVVAGTDLYGGSNRLLTYLKNTLYIKVHHVDTTVVEQVLEKVNDKTAMVLLESPTNPLIQIVDVREICEKVHAKNPNTLKVVDNTMMSPIFMRPLELGADIVYESATKYLCGHHDVMAGIIATNDMDIGNRLYNNINSYGAGLSPFDCWLLLRGIKTLSLRVHKQQDNAQKVADFLADQGFKVRYPGRKDWVGYETHQSQCTGNGAVLAFRTGDVKLSEEVVSSTQLWGISVSFGCVNSLISLPCKMSHASIDAKVRAERQFPEDIIRLCVGIENPDDLIDDLRQALIKSGAIKVKKPE